MDEPLFSYKRRSPPVEDGSWSDDHCIHSKLKHLLKHDNKDDFVELINRCPVTELEDHYLSLRVFMLTDDAAKCAAAVLDRETQIPDITVLMPCNPLCYSVGYSAVRIMALLLQRGFSADVTSPSNFIPPHALPLGVGLHNLRRRITFFYLPKEGTCAVNFTIVLFMELIRSALEMLRLLATKTRDIKHEFFNYLKEGKMVEVGALLLVARSRILSSSTGEGEFSSILEMHDFLSKEILSAADDKLIEMEQTLLLLKIFDRIGDKLEVLIQQDPFRIGQRKMLAADLLEGAGFDVKDIPPSKCEIVCVDDDFLKEGHLYNRKIAMAKDEPFSSSSGPQKESTELSCNYCGKSGHVWSESNCDKYKRIFRKSLKKFTAANNKLKRFAAE